MMSDYDGLVASRESGQTATCAPSAPTGCCALAVLLLKEEQDVLVEKAARIMRENLRSLIDEALKRCAKHGSNQ